MFRMLGSLSGENMDAILAWHSIRIFSSARVACVCVEPKSMLMMITAMTLQNGRRRGKGEESANAFRSVHDSSPLLLHRRSAHIVFTRGIPRISAIICVPRSHCKMRTHTKIQICIRSTTYRIIHSQIIKQIFLYGDRKGRKGAKRKSRGKKVLKSLRIFLYFSILVLLPRCLVARGWI